jgi:hypothetical protein
VDAPEAVSKNPNRHSAAGEESHVFLFKSKNQKRDPSAYSLRMTIKSWLINIRKRITLFVILQTGKKISIFY